MAEIQPLRALHYDLSVTGGLQDVVAPPYDVIDAAQRAELMARSPYNVVSIDLPEGEDPYASADEQLEHWRMQGAVVHDREPALWALEQDYTAPDGRRMTRHGFFCRVRVQDYGPGAIRPHERTHPGPKEDRLRLTRATRANLSPIFSLYSDPAGSAWGALEPALAQPAWGEATDADGTLHRLWRIADPEAIATVIGALAPAELLIADGHHRYETARVYAEEIGGEGPHRFVLMCLVALEDPGLTVFATHRLVRGLDSRRQEALAQAIRRDFEITEVSRDELAPPAGAGPLELGYIDAHFKRPFRLRLRDQAIADAALAEHSAPYRRLDTGVLEALLLKGALGLTDDDISHLRDFGYARDVEQALGQVESGAYDAAFVMRPTPVAQVRELAAAGENMPPKSTYFFPKVLTGMLLNPLE
ncbi:MAG TPA: DUF1015 domain-containing protein [Solirubrobacteraceae bacterium]|jgi:uncharacterized protein (DUF1015 family)|nr:DUF1015 domain-containing protein [Solirubrobacteraceae bacterium]